MGGDNGRPASQNGPAAGQSDAAATHHREVANMEIRWCSFTLLIFFKNYANLMQIFWKFYANLLKNSWKFFENFMKISCKSFENFMQIFRHGLIVEIF